MSLASYIRALPKVEVYVQLEGSMRRHILMMLADQNSIPDTLKHYNQWVGLIDTPDIKRMGEIVKMASSWMQTGDDLRRIAYDLGVALHHQGVRYAEVSVNPAFYEGIGLSFDEFFEAINDGRDRAARGWGIEIGWILTMGRDEPRRSDEYARYAAASASQMNIIALGISGREDIQPVGQFERAFRAVEKKGLPRVARAGDVQGAAGIMTVIEGLAPNRIIDARGLLDSEEAMQAVAGANIGVAVSIARAHKQGWVTQRADYPLRRLYDADILVTLASDMPSFYGTSLNDEYIAAVEKSGMSIAELEEIALNAVRMSFLDDDRKATMIAEFQDEYAHLRLEHLAAEQPA